MEDVSEENINVIAMGGYPSVGNIERKSNIDRGSKRGSE